MHRLFVGNFDFEHRLAGNRSKAASESVRRINAELASIWVGIAEDGDRILCDAAIEPGFYARLAAQGLPRVEAVESLDESRSWVSERRDWEIVSWGALDELAQQAAVLGLRYDAPSEAVVRRANSRRLSFDLETAWGVGLPGAAVLHSIDDLRAALRQLPPEFDEWVVKAEFSMSARERILGRGREPSEANVNWLKARLQADGVAFFEPWTRRVAEVGLQFTIHSAADIQLEGVAGLLSDASGAYRGSRLSSHDASESEWLDAIATGHSVARRLGEEGYFGPLGIDAVRYRDTQGGVRLRPIQDINARYTMGRIALGFRRFLKAGESATWLHLRSPAGTRSTTTPERAIDPFAWYDGLERRLPTASRLIRTSPLTVDGTPTRLVTALLISTDHEAHRRAEIDLLRDEPV